MTASRGFCMHRIMATLLLTAIRSYSGGTVGTTDARNGKAALSAPSTTVLLQWTGGIHEASDRETSAALSSDFHRS